MAAAAAEVAAEATAAEAAAEAAEMAMAAADSWGNCRSSAGRLFSHDMRSKMEVSFRVLWLQLAISIRIFLF